MADPYKLHIKLGNSEFNAEGEEVTVREDFRAFLEAVSRPLPNHHQGGGTGQAESTTQQTDRQNGFGAIGDDALERVFQQDGDVVSLRVLPPDGATRAADAAILLLYGYRRLQQLREVPVLRLNEGLRRSGVSFDRLDRIIGVHNGLYLKGGQKIGSRYSLHNQGVTQAESWIRNWFM